MLLIGWSLDFEVRECAFVEGCTTCHALQGSHTIAMTLTGLGECFVVLGRGGALLQAVVVANQASLVSMCGKHYQDSK